MTTEHGGGAGRMLRSIPRGRASRKKTNNLAIDAQRGVPVWARDKEFTEVGEAIRDELYKNRSSGKTDPQ